MFDTNVLIDNLQKYGVGRRKFDDKLFSADRIPVRLGVYDDDEDLCQTIVTSMQTLTCTVPGCVFTATSLLDLENHYNASHRYRCSECRRTMPSPHFLDLHLQETHDSFFAVMAARKPSYCCYIKECSNKFMNAEERLDHCIKTHKLPKDFRFEIKSKGKDKVNKKDKPQTLTDSMDVDNSISDRKPQHFFHNNKKKSLIKYSGKKFTSDKNPKPTSSSNMDEMVSDLRENLPI